eukprot:1038195-Pleurochrysis_carterae.AAC.5
MYVIISANVFRSPGDFYASPMLPNSFLRIAIIASSAELRRNISKSPRGPPPCRPRRRLTAATVRVYGSDRAQLGGVRTEHFRSATCALPAHS